MQFGMRLLLACATLCVARPADLLASSSLWASSDLAPAATSFAYVGKHDTSALTETAIEALRSKAENEEGEKFSPVVMPRYKQVRVFSRDELCATAATVAQVNDLPAPFFANLIQQESGFKPHVVSRAGAQGIAQFMPRVATAYGLTN